MRCDKQQAKNVHSRGDSTCAASVDPPATWQKLVESANLEDQKRVMSLSFFLGLCTPAWQLAMPAVVTLMSAARSYVIHDCTDGFGEGRGNICLAAGQ